MKLVVIGATGATGRLVIDQALQRGHEVTAYVRRAEALEQRQGLTIVAGQLQDQAALQDAMRGADALLCTLGTHSLVGVNLMRTHLPFVTRAMLGAKVRRLVLLSAYGVGETAGSATLFARFIYKTLVSSVYKDKEQSEAELARVGLKWTGVYPVILTNGPFSEAVEVRPLSNVRKVAGMPKVSRANVASAMLDAAENDKAIGQRLLVTPRGTVQ